MPVNKPIGTAAFFTAEVRNAEGVLLPDAVVTFTDDSADPVVVDPASPHVGVVTGSTIETVTVTASVDGADGPVTATDTATFSDNTPASITLTAS